jgi:peptidoglycan hydrolase-like protein with peptidoglycan-binding domain
MTHSARVLVLLMIGFACAHEHAQQPAAGSGGPAGPEAVQVKSTTKPVAKPTGPHAGSGRPELAPAPAGLMIPGAVEQIQAALEHRGLLAGEKRGELDEKTAEAIRQFQGQMHLAKTGVPDHETVRQLGLDVDQIYKPPPL